MKNKRKLKIMKEKTLLNLIDPGLKFGRNKPYLVIKMELCAKMNQ